LALACVVGLAVNSGVAFVGAFFGSIMFMAIPGPFGFFADYLWVLFLSGIIMVLLLFKMVFGR